MEDVALASHTADALATAPRAHAEPDLTLVPDADPELGSMAVRRSPEQAEQLVLGLIAAHADSLLRTARRYSLCADDAQDAYQRGLEILMRHAPRLDADRAGGWLHTVVKHEALAINRARCRVVGGEEVDFDAIEMRTAPSPEERILGFEQVARSAEALQRLKPQEVRALWLKAMGNSYQEICDATGWSYTKVNRCLAEGRKSFLARYAGIETGEECRRWAPVLSAMVDGEATADQVMQLRPHLRNCAGCRAALRELRGSNAPLAALFPAGGVTLLGGPGGFEGAGDALSRLWHALWGDLSDRAATAALRAQSMAHAILPGRSMAIVASVAAIAGGGFAIDEAVPDAPHTARHVPTVSAAADRLTASRVTPAALRPATTSTAASRSTARTQKPKRTRTRRPRVRRHRTAPAVRHEARLPASAPAAPPSSGAAANRTGTATATPANAATSAPAATRPAIPAPKAAAAPAPTPAPAPRSPAAEFGLETR
jgi:RNA polymerase sigma factor (sigma-70 family)